MSLLFHTEEKQTFVKSSDSEILKLVANAVLESRKKSTKYAVNVFGSEESYKYTYRFSPTQTYTESFRKIEN